MTMSLPKYFYALFFLFVSLAINSQTIGNKDVIDVKDYLIELTVNDTTDVIEGIATISLKVKKAEKQFSWVNTNYVTIYNHDNKK